MEETQSWGRIETWTRSGEGPIGRYRFATRLRLFMPHLLAAAQQFSENEQEGPGFRLYTSRDEQGRDARGALFHLQALSRIYRKTHKKDRETFDVFRHLFKEIEDALGRINYHEEMGAAARQLGAPEAVVGYFVGGYHAELQNLTRRLRDSGWLAVEGAEVGFPALEEILDDLDRVRWRKDRKDRRRIVSFLIAALDKVLEKGGATGTGLDFDDLEHGVHEFRRTVRWVSIYPQALGGLCRLVREDRLDSDLAVYHPPQVVESGFCRYSRDDRETESIELEASLLFAFTYLIGALGDLKDRGQLAEALEHAFERTGVATGEECQARVAELLGTEGVSPDEIPSRVRTLVEAFIGEHQIPQRLKACLESQLD